MTLLNIQTTSRDKLRRAFDAIEGTGFFDRSESADSQSITSARLVLADCRETWQRNPDLCENDQESIPETIYGAGGGNRYIVLLDGSIHLSKMHAGAMLYDNATTRKARALGFGLW